MATKKQILTRIDETNNWFQSVFIAKGQKVSNLLIEFDKANRLLQDIKSFLLQPDYSDNDNGSVYTQTMEAISELTKVDKLDTYILHQKYKHTPSMIAKLIRDGAKTGLIEDLGNGEIRLNPKATQPQPAIWKRYPDKKPRVPIGFTHAKFTALRKTNKGDPFIDTYSSPFEKCYGPDEKEEFLWCYESDLIASITPGISKSEDR